MSREKGRKWDGVSRVPDDTYRKNWEEIFGKQEKFNKIVDLLPDIVIGGAAFFTLLVLSINWLIKKIRK